MPDKKWLKRKGCKNCALVWKILPHHEECDTDCEGHGEWLVEPYYPGREFVYISKIINSSGERIHLHNVYFNDRGNLVRRKKG